MAQLNPDSVLTVVIPALEEARTLPLLLADLGRWPIPLRVIVVDGGSSDATAAAAQRAGAEVLRCSVRGRGQQLSLGTQHVKAGWILVLHADSRLIPQWPAAVQAVMITPETAGHAWFFDFRVDARGLMLRLLETAVALRSRWLQRPYGDQGLLIEQDLLQRVGGYRPMALMEDLDLVQRLSGHGRLKRIGVPLITSGRRWRQRSVLQLAWHNARLRQRWRRGDDPDALLRAYRSGSDAVSSRTRTRSDAVAAPAPNPGAGKN